MKNFALHDFKINKLNIALAIALAASIAGCGGGGGGATPASSLTGGGFAGNNPLVGVPVKVQCANGVTGTGTVGPTVAGVVKPGELAVTMPSNCTAPARVTVNGAGSMCPIGKDCSAPGSPNLVAYDPSVNIPLGAVFTALPSATNLWNITPLSTLVASNPLLANLSSATFAADFLTVTNSVAASLNVPASALSADYTNPQTASASTLVADTVTLAAATAAGGGVVTTPSQNALTLLANAAGAGTPSSLANAASVATALNTTVVTGVPVINVTASPSLATIDADAAAVKTIITAAVAIAPPTPGNSAAFLTAIPANITAAQTPGSAANIAATAAIGAAGVTNLPLQVTDHGNIATANAALVSATAQVVAVYNAPAVSGVPATPTQAQLATLNTAATTPLPANTASTNATLVLVPIQALAADVTAVNLGGQTLQLADAAVADAAKQVLLIQNLGTAAQASQALIDQKAVIAGAAVLHLAADLAAAQVVGVTAAQAAVAATDAALQVATITANGTQNQVTTANANLTTIQGVVAQFVTTAMNAIANDLTTVTTAGVQPAAATAAVTDAVTQQAIVNTYGTAAQKTTAQNQVTQIQAAAANVVATLVNNAVNALAADMTTVNAAGVTPAAALAAAADAATQAATINSFGSAAQKAQAQTDLTTIQNKATQVQTTVLGAALAALQTALSTANNANSTLAALQGAATSAATQVSVITVANGATAAQVTQAGNDLTTINNAVTAKQQALTTALNNAIADMVTQLANATKVGATLAAVQAAATAATADVAAIIANGGTAAQVQAAQNDLATINAALLALTPSISFAATNINSLDIKYIGVNDPVNLGAAYTGAPVAFGPYLVTGVPTATAFTIPAGVLKTVTTVKVNALAAAATGTVVNGDSITVLVDMASYALNTLAGPLAYNTVYSPKVSVGAATVTFGNAAGGGILTCADPLTPPPAGNVSCK